MYLVKPFTEIELGEKLEAALGASALENEGMAPEESNSSELSLAPSGDGKRQGEPVEMEASGASSDGLRILVAEDNSVNRTVIEKMLKKEGHTVIMAEDGREAMDAFRRARREERGFDLILMDVQMPDVSGLEATRYIRDEEAKKDWSAVPIVALTARVLEQDREECLEAGMDEYLSKPLDRSKLRAVLHEIEGNATRQVVPAEEDNEQQVRRGEGGNQEVLNREQLLRRVDRDPDFLQTIVDQFLEESDAYIEKMESALDRQDGGALAEAAHALKGAAGTLQSEETEGVAATLESLGRNEKLQEARSALQRLKTTVDRLQTRLLELKQDVGSNERPQ